jgi:hypothetical protein
VLDIHHERNVKDAPLYVSHVELELEIRGHSHLEEISSALKRNGIDIELR